jgi:hypothetical protein
MASADMVEDPVEEISEPPVPARRGQGIEIGVVTEAGVDAQVIGGVVAVGLGGQDRPSARPDAPSSTAWSSQPARHRVTETRTALPDRSWP